MAFQASRIVFGFFVLLDLVLGGVGLTLLLHGGSRARLRRVEALPVATAATLASLPPGTPVLVDGRIAAETPAGFREFVAWEKDQFAGYEEKKGGDRLEKWNRVETVTPPLRVVTGDGSVSVLNSRYELDSPRHDWREPVPSQIGLFEKMPFRARGFFAGDAVLLEGTVVAEIIESGASSRRGLEISTMFGGDRGAYLQSLRDAVFVQRLLGGIFLAIGAVGIVVLIVVHRLVRRPSGAKRR